MQDYGQSVYKRTDILTADRGKLVVLLYEGAIRYLKEAQQSIGKKDREGKCTNLNRAMDVIQELNYSLKMAEGGEVASNLRKLYWFMEKYLIKAKIEKDSVKKIDEVIVMLTSLCEAWKGILENPEVKELRTTDGLAAPGLSRGIAV